MSQRLVWKMKVVYPGDRESGRHAAITSQLEARDIAARIITTTNAVQVTLVPTLIGSEDPLFWDAAEKAGHDAFSAGAKMTDDPHRADSPESRSWRWGFHRAALEAPYEPDLQDAAAPGVADPPPSGSALPGNPDQARRCWRGRCAKTRQPAHDSCDGSCEDGDRAFDEGASFGRGSERLRIVNAIVARYASSFADDFRKGERRPHQWQVYADVLELIDQKGDQQHAAGVPDSDTGAA